MRVQRVERQTCSPASFPVTGLQLLLVLFSHRRSSSGEALISWPPEDVSKGLCCFGEGQRKFEWSCRGKSERTRNAFVAVGSFERSGGVGEEKLASSSHMMVEPTPGELCLLKAICAYGTNIPARSEMHGFRRYEV